MFNSSMGFSSFQLNSLASSHNGYVGAPQTSYGMGSSGYSMGFAQPSFGGFAQPSFGGFDQFSPTSYARPSFSALSPNATQTSSGGVDQFTRPGLSPAWGNTDVPTDWANVSSGMFGNIHGMLAILSRYVSDNMPTANQDPTAPGNTWAYTTFGTETPAADPAEEAAPATETPVAEAPATPTTTEAPATPATPTPTNTHVADPYSRPGLSSEWGNSDIPTSWASISSGLFGNIHGVNAINSRYVGDMMPTAGQDPTAPGNTWAYTTFKY